MEQRSALAILLITSILLGLAGGLTAAFIAARPGPQGEQGATGQGGLQGPVGPAGPQGEQGLAGPQGEQGPAGEQGVQGIQGEQGPQGPQGPAGPAGTDGAANNDIYKKASGAWVKETNIAAGANGATWLSGSGAPGSSLGNDGDYYLDTDTGDVYNKATGTWTVITNINGEQGEQGPQGPQGPQGEQGPPGTDGTNSIIQVIYSRNSTIFETQSYATMQWVNMSELDSSMIININVQQNSRLLIQFSASISITSPGSLQTRIVVDNIYISTVSVNSVSSASTGIIKFSDHIEFVTDPLNTGIHSINLQVLRENGSPTILDRTITVMEITSP